MDESRVTGSQLLRDGFVGQRMFVLPRPAVLVALGQPATNRLLVTDVGVFPRASRHGRNRPYGAAQHALLVCTGGSGWCRTPSGKFKIRRGDAVVLPAKVEHQYGASAEDPWTLWWMHFVGSDAAELAQTALSAAGGPVSHLRDPTPVASLLARVLDAMELGTTGGLVLASGAAWHALAHLIATGRRAAGTCLSPVDQAVEHLRATTPRRTSVESLAALVGLSPAHFGTLFRQQVGMPPVRYQNQLRMARARELLDSTDWLVSKISSDCGYEDPLYFSRQFVRTHGQSPTAYRSRAR